MLPLVIERTLASLVLTRDAGEKLACEIGIAGGTGFAESRA